ncbi:MAG TPA: ThiF family adenylyltransferase, partial [Roseiarcus sp.]|nr:ThiF family adenylyltransferase [Roseiarcus sp.]
LRKKRVAIAGLGGCGGTHVATLARLGIGAFTLADFDRFELVNFNRQYGARMSTLGKPKVDVLRDVALDINPELRIRTFHQGVQEESIDRFLEGADIYVDAIDVFALEMRRKIYARCRALGIPAVLSVPAGMGTVFLVFMPDGMSLEEWFCFDDVEPSKRIVNFIVGVAPLAVHRSYLVDNSTINLETRDFPSTGLACELCAGVTAAQTLKILLGRGKIEAVPFYHSFDAYTLEYKKGKIPGGNRNWRQRAKLASAYEEFAELARNSQTQAKQAASA